MLVPRENVRIPRAMQALQQAVLVASAWASEALNAQWSCSCADVRRGRSRGDWDRSWTATAKARTKVSTEFLKPRKMQNIWRTRGPVVAGISYKGACPSRPGAPISLPNLLSMSFQESNVISRASNRSTYRHYNARRRRNSDACKFHNVLLNLLPTRLPARSDSEKVQRIRSAEVPTNQNKHSSGSTTSTNATSKGSI